MNLLQQLDPLRLYTPAEAAGILGTAVTENWVKCQARKHPELSTRHTGRRTILFTSQQVILLHTLLTGTIGPAPGATPGQPRDAAVPAADVADHLVGAPEQPPTVAPRPFRSLHAGP